MQAIRKFVDVTGSSVTIDLPPDWHLKKAEVIVLPIDESGEAAQKESWESFVGRTMGSIPDFPDRFPQGEYEARQSFDD